MIYNQIDSRRYMAEFKDKFTNFAQKAPILISFIINENNVIVIHENTKSNYTFSWDFTVPVKSFINSIKQVLSEKHYPRLLKIEETFKELTEDEKAELVESGLSIDNLPKTQKIIKETLYRIDKCIMFKDIFIIIDEKTNKKYLYKMNGSCGYFLKSYRSGKYTLESAGKYFFENSSLVKELSDIDTNQQG